MFTTATWFTYAFARATTVSASRSDVPVSVTWKIASAPCHASDRKTSGKTPSWQIASPNRPTPSMSKHTVLRAGHRCLVRLPRKALAVARDELARRRQHERGVRDSVARALVDAAGDEPQPGLARERTEALGQLARHVDRELAPHAALLEQRRHRHQVQLGRDDELEPWRTSSAAHGRRARTGRASPPDPRERRRSGARRRRVSGPPVDRNMGNARAQTGQVHRFGLAHRSLASGTMPRYVVERTFPEGLEIPADAQGAMACLGIVERNADDGVTWIRSYVTGDRSKTFCVYDAPEPRGDPPDGRLERPAGRPHHRGPGSRSVLPLLSRRARIIGVSSRGLDHPRVRVRAPRAHRRARGACRRARRGRRDRSREARARPRRGRDRQDRGEGTRKRLELFGALEELEPGRGDGRGHSYSRQ